MLLFLNTHTDFYLVGIFVLGLIIGSFLNVVIARLPHILFAHWQGSDKTTPFYLAWPPSQCPKCQVKILPRHNIPILSYLFLRGRCINCKRSISLRYPLIELLTAVFSMLIAWHFGISITTLCALILLWGLICLGFIDIDHHLLPDCLTLPLLWLGLFINSFNLFTNLPDALYGVITGYLSLWLLYWAFKLVTGKEGMGYGDFKLVALLGAWFGWQYLPVIIFLSSLSGILVSLILMACKKSTVNTPQPFGPHLIMAGLITLFFSDILILSYQKILEIH